MLAFAGGYGLLLILNQEELPEHMPEAVTRKEYPAFGNLFLNRAGNGGG
ncbi:MAG: hypothetical protein ACTFAK_09335 [Candidatus Electronema sp. VV]